MKAVSGKFVLRISPKLHLLLRNRSLKMGISLNEICLRILSSSSHQNRMVQNAPSSLLTADFMGVVVRHWRKYLQTIVLFGSAVRNEMTEASDVDLLFVLKKEFSLTRQFYREWDAFFEKHQHLLLHTREVTAQFVQLPTSVLEAGGLWYETAAEGEILWERGKEVSRFYRDIRLAMTTGKIRRRISHGHPYWIKGDS